MLGRRTAGRSDRGRGARRRPRSPLVGSAAPGAPRAAGATSLTPPRNRDGLGHVGRPRLLRPHPTSCRGRAPRAAVIHRPECAHGQAVGHRLVRSQRASCSPGVGCRPAASDCMSSDAHRRGRRPPRPRRRPRHTRAGDRHPAAVGDRRVGGRRRHAPRALRAGTQPRADDPRRHQHLGAARARLDAGRRHRPRPARRGPPRRRAARRRGARRPGGRDGAHPRAPRPRRGGPAVRRAHRHPGARGGARPRRPGRRRRADHRRARAAGRRDAGPHVRLDLVRPARRPRAAHRRHRARSRHHRRRPPRRRARAPTSTRSSGSARSPATARWSRSCPATGRWCRMPRRWSRSTASTARSASTRCARRSPTARRPRTTRWRECCGGSTREVPSEVWPAARLSIRAQLEYLSR